MKPYFWIIFDLATRPNYRRDVHNILALPRNAVIRYEYRTEYLSERALHYSRRTKMSPKRALVVFAQSLDPDKVDSPPKDEPVHTTFPNTMWVATRLCEVVHIPPQEGTTFSYYLRAQYYPRNIEQELIRILEPLKSIEELPFKKLVTISDQIDALSNLEGGSETENWQQIVSKLALPPSKFAGNVFWRLETASEIMPIDSSLSRDFQLPPDDLAWYRVPEASKKTILVTAYEPSDLAKYRSQLGIAEATLTISHSDDKEISIEGAPSTIRLEQYGTKPLTIIAGHRREIGKHIATITLHTGVRSGCPIGPDFKVFVEVYKSRWRKIALWLVFTAAVVSGALAYYCRETHPGWSAFFVGTTAIIGGVWVLLLTGEYKIGLPLFIFVFSLLVL